MNERMNDSDVEEAIRRAMEGGPAEGLRGRVLSTVGAELAIGRRRSRWSFAAGLAASVLLGINLGMSAARTFSLPSGSGLTVDAARLDATSRALVEAVPELPASEARRQIVLAQARGQLPQVLLPAVRDGDVIP